jgi:hypothetical protein
MSQRLGFALALAVLAAGCGSARDAEAPGDVAQPGARTIDFDDMPAGQPSRGFTTGLTGGGGPVRWIVREDPEGGKVLAQESPDDTDFRFPLCVYDGFEARDVSASCRYLAQSGEIDQVGGVIVRYRDPRNYYIARANALEDNVRLYRVVDGERRQFAGERLVVAPKVWHELRLDARGSTFSVWLDGKLLFTAEDSTFQEPGKVGLWTKSDSVTWFDDLRFADLGP